jgi:hypothetical protein
MKYIRYNAESPTIKYIALEITEFVPNIKSTRLKLKSPTRPQLSPPIITNTDVIQSSAFLFVKVSPDFKL